MSGLRKPPTQISKNGWLWALFRKGWLWDEGGRSLIIAKTVMNRKKSKNVGKERIPTIDDIVKDPITNLASEYWASHTEESSFDLNVIKSLYHNEIETMLSSRLQLLEFSGYLENYLWRYYTPENVCHEHTLSVMALVNEKCRDGASPVFQILTGDEEKFQLFFGDVIALSETEMDITQWTVYISFLTNVYRSLEDISVRRCSLKYLSLPIWKNLSRPRLESELDRFPQLQRHWEHLDIQSTVQLPQPTVQPAKKRKKNDKKTDVVGSELAKDADANWIPSLIKFFFHTLNRNSEATVDTIVFLEKFLELLIDLLSQIPTRRFLNTLLDDMHFVLRCKLFPLKDELFRRLLSSLESLISFEVNDQTGQSLTSKDVLSNQTARVHQLQKIAFSHYGDILKDLVFSSTGELGKSDVLRKHLLLLDNTQLVDLATKMGYVGGNDATWTGSTVEPEQAARFSLDVLLEKLSFKRGQLESLNRLSLYPTEDLLWDGNQIPLSSHYSGSQPLALPKLNLQFLTIHDYLLRNFTLYRLESAFEVREDLVDAIKRMGPREGPRGVTIFGGWARMALPIASVSIDEVTKPLLGDIVPHRVSCTVEVDLSRFTGEIRVEWESLREHDVVFLVCIERPQPEAAKDLPQYESERADLAKGKKPQSQKDFQWAEDGLDFPSKYGVKFVRGGEIFEMKDEDNIVLNDPMRPDERKSGRVGNKRIIRMNLDPAQYYSDVRDEVNCYETLNLLVRRKPEENNFKAILETIRDLMNTSAVGRAIPPWLHDLFLGYGSPAAASYRNMSKDVEDLDYTDTFLDANHLIESFPGVEITFNGGPESEAIVVSEAMEVQTLALPPPPYRLVIHRGADPSATEEKGRDRIIVNSYRPPNPGPYPEDMPPRNTVRFTPAQIDAIRSGMNPGLTMVVGPPGTGKTDVAVQIITSLYHNFPTHKILLVTHSNAALNDLFEKIMKCNVDPRHLLRLGSGERDLREALALAGAGGSGRGQGEEFSKQGRVNWSLSRRAELLTQVQRLAVSLGVPGDVGYTCETAQFFRLEHVQSRIERFEAELANVDGLGDGEKSLAHKNFPFQIYFSDAPTQLFTGDNDSDLESARGCFRHLQKLFEELEDYRAFEILRTQAHRTDYLLTKQARIVAMTCTHAAMTRRRLVELGFKYDSLVMEEAAQVLEVETLIPMLLQNTDPVDGCRLKRVVLIGDHFQLPPVVKHAALQKFAKLDQSLFTRFVRLGVPNVLLNKQGRARAEIASLYTWRYSGIGGRKADPSHSLGDLESISTIPEYQRANAGFVHTFQLINVPAFKGKGEFTPTPHFFQNLGEAEYVVAMYQYMRLLGYPAEKISIITTYNGQTHLIRDIINQRCRSAIFGRPARVTTVDKFQGQQNDYILLSLVRTESVGHLRDVRRLVVALSRARLGLYVFCRQELFENCYELSPAFNQLLKRPPKLQLVVGESFPSSRPSGGEGSFDAESVFTVDDVTAMGVLVYQMVQQSQKLQESVVSTSISDAVEMVVPNDSNGLVDGSQGAEVEDKDAMDSTNSD